MNRVIDLILLEMKPELSEYQQNALEQTLIRILSRYEITSIENEILRVGDFFHQYLCEFILYEKANGRSDGTIKQYIETTDKLFRYLQKDVRDIRDTDIRRFLLAYEQNRKCSKIRIDNMRRNLSSFFNFCCNVHYIDINPCNSIKPIKSPKSIKKAYTKQEMNKLSNTAANIRDKAIVSLLRSSGIRVSELCSIDKMDINWANNSFFVWGKGDKEREVCFNDNTKHILKEYLNSRTDTSPALFVHIRSDKRLQKGGVESMIRKLGYKSNVHAYPHKFRRTLITNALDQRMQPHLVAKFAGHTSIKTTMIYCNVDIKKMKKEYKKLNL